MKPVEDTALMNPIVYSKIPYTFLSTAGPLVVVQHSADSDASVLLSNELISPHAQEYEDVWRLLAKT